MIGPLRYTRKGDVISTPGIDYGPTVAVIAEGADRMLLKAAGHKVWSGNYQPWKHYGTMYMAVEKMAPGNGNVVREEQPGHGWRKVVGEMKAWVFGVSRSGA